MLNNGKAVKIADLQIFAGHVTGIINQLKLGQLCEAQFDSQFISKFSDSFGLEITIKQLNDAWQAMHSYDIEKVIGELNTLASLNQGDKSIVICSFTDAKDIRIISKLLTEQYIQFSNDEAGNISQINGMEMHLSYVQQTDKKRLVETIAKSEIEKGNQPVVVITPNNIENEVLKAQDAFSKEGLKLMLDQLQIPGLLWKKDHESLYEFLVNQVQTLRVVNLCKL